MPYIRIKAYPKDEATKRKVAEEVFKAFADNWGCAPDAISISFEEVAPDRWEEQVVKKEMQALADKMMVLNGTFKDDIS